MHRTLLPFLLACSSCATTYAVAADRTPHVALHALDVTAMSVGTIVGLSEYNGRERDELTMWLGFGPALAIWASYWLVRTDRD